MTDASRVELMSNRRRGIRPWTCIALLVALGITLSVIDWRTALLVIIATLGTYLGASQPSYALALLSLTLPVQQHVQVGFESASLTVTKVALWSIVIGWGLALVTAKQRVQVDFATMALLAVVATLIVSVWNARDGGLWIGETYRWFSTAVVSVFAFNVFRRGASPVPFLVSSVVGSAAVSAIAAWQVLQRIGPSTFESRGLTRAYGSFGHPNQLAIYLELGAPLFLALVLNRTRSRNGEGSWFIDPRLYPLWCIGFAGCLGGLMISQSRGGGVGMVVGLAAVALLSSRRIRNFVLPLAPIILMGSLAALTVSVAIVAAGVRSFGSDEIQVTPANFAVQERLAHWTAAVEMAKSYPYVGIGAGNYDLNFRDFTQDWRFRIGRGHAHDTYLHMLAQAGVLGLTAYLVLLLGVALIISRTMRILEDGSRMALMIGVAGVTGATCAHAIFEYVHVLSLNLLLAISWAMAVAIGTEAWAERIRNLSRLKIA